VILVRAQILAGNPHRSIYGLLVLIVTKGDGQEHFTGSLKYVDAYRVL
jgi:hypothetical protein